MHAHECGKLRFTLTPEPKITYMNSAMLRILHADTAHDSWMQALKSKPNFFLSEEDVPLFRECCKQAEAGDAPAYFKYHLFDRRLCKIPAHGWVCQPEDSDEFVMVVMTDKELDNNERSSFVTSISHVYDDVFEIDKVSSTVKVIKNSSAIDCDMEGTQNLWEFGDFLFTRLVHPHDREAYVAFVDALISSDTPSTSSGCGTGTKSSAGCT